MTNDVRIIPTDQRDNASDERHDFGFIDRLGRKVGARVIQYEVDYVEMTQDYLDKHQRATGYCYSWRGTPGHKFKVWAHNTRNGETYGSACFSRVCSSAEERDEALLKYLNDSSRQLRKKFAEYNR